MRKRIIAASLGVAGLAVAGLSGCGGWDAAHNYNAPTPVKTWRPAGGWTRIETPGNFPSMVMGCRYNPVTHAFDGIYDNMDSSSSPFVVPNDPLCASK